MLTNEQQLKIFDLMVKTRVYEERVIRLTRSGDCFFWIGGPGEEAFNIPLGLQVKKGRGLNFDFLHLHYRSSGILIAMGEPPLECLRQAVSSAYDRYSGGRNFVNHQAIPEWNVAPIMSPIGVNWPVAPGTAYAQKLHGGTGITIAVGGDAGTSEGDFASALLWSTIPGREVPLLMIITNNRWGISTADASVHQEGLILRRAQAFGIKAARVDGNDPEASWEAIANAMTFVRNERRPYLIEALVSRLYGHSSASGANRQDEPDCIEHYKNRLIQRGLLTEQAFQETVQKYIEETTAAVRQAKSEPKPKPEVIYQNIFAPRIRRVTRG